MGIVVAIVVKVGVFHDTSSRALRRTQRSYAARAGRLAGLALAAFDEPGPSASRPLNLVREIPPAAGPADEQIRSAGAPDPAGEPASSQSAAAAGGEPDR